MLRPGPKPGRLSLFQRKLKKTQEKMPDRVAAVIEEVPGSSSDTAEGKRQKISRTDGAI